MNRAPTGGGVIPNEGVKSFFGWLIRRGKVPVLCGRPIHRAMIY